LPTTSALLERSCTSFTVWGFTDTYTWVRKTFRGDGSANLHTEQYEAKGAYEALPRDLALALRHPYVTIPPFDPLSNPF
jgi:endo-1,4-beta-xylanase